MRVYAVYVRPHLLCELIVVITAATTICTTAFGDGVYLAEDVAKTDQYGAPDVRFDPASELHKRLYGKHYRHEGSVFYVLLCRAGSSATLRARSARGEMRPTWTPATGSSRSASASWPPSRAWRRP